MAMRLSVKQRKKRRDQKTAYLKGEAPARHKVSLERSKRALKKKAYTMA